MMLFFRGATWDMGWSTVRAEDSPLRWDEALELFDPVRHELNGWAGVGVLLRVDNDH